MQYVLAKDVIHADPRTSFPLSTSSSLPVNSRNQLVPEIRQLLHFIYG